MAVVLVLVLAAAVRDVVDNDDGVKAFVNVDDDNNKETKTATLTALMVYIYIYRMEFKNKQLIPLYPV